MLRFGLPLIVLFCACSSSSDSKPAPGSDLPAADDPTLTGTPLHHILSTGQSNSVGFNAKPPLTKAQPYANLMFDPGVMTVADCDGDGCKTYQEPKQLVPLVEGDTYDSEPVETMSSGLANEIGKLTGGKHEVLVSVHGRSGNTYECLRKSGCRFLDGKGYVFGFDEAVKQMRAAHQLATAAGRPYIVNAVTTIHGESDHVDNPFPLPSTRGEGTVQNYADALIEWQKDYEDAVKAETKQTDAVPLLLSQMANWNDREDSEIPTRQLEAHDRAAGKVVLIGATYMLPFTDDCIHYTSEGERRLGEYFAKAYKKIAIDKEKWEPLRPTSVQLADATITVKFHVPVPPLVLDTTQVADPGSLGFVYVDDGPETPTISDVKLGGADTVVLTLSAAPTAAHRHLRYALRATPDTCPGPQTGPRGNIRDSDTTASQTKVDLANWSVSFDAAVP